MKKVYYFLLFIGIVLNAQSFPAPYCSITEGTVESITFIQMDETLIPNFNENDILIDKTNKIVNVERGETYTLNVKGNTRGEFTNQFFAFIDWNQNFVLDDEGEVYDLGTIFDSSGVDGEDVELDITVPADAVEGTTRIRISKIYQDNETIAIADPCAISMELIDFGSLPGFGQALDFTLQIGSLSTSEVSEKDLQVYPNPAKNVLFITSVYELKSVEIYNVLGQLVLSQKLQDNSARIDISKLNIGTYFINFMTIEDKKLSHKFIKN